MRKTKFSRILSVVLVCMLTLSALSVAFSASAATYVPKTAKAKGVKIIGVAGEALTSIVWNDVNKMVDGNTYGAGADGYWGSTWTSTPGICGDTYITFDLGYSQTVTALTVYHRADVLFLHMGDYAIYVTDEAPDYDDSNPKALPTGLPTTPSATGTVAKPTTFDPVELTLDKECTGRYVTLNVKNLADKENASARSVQIAEVEFEVRCDEYIAPATVDAEGVTVLGAAGTKITETQLNETNRTVDGVITGTNSWGTAWTNVKGTCGDTYITFDLGYSQTVSALKVYNRSDALYTVLGKYEIFVTDEAPVYDATKPTQFPTGLPTNPSQKGEVTENEIAAINELKLDNRCTGRYVTLHVIDLANKTHNDARAVHILEMKIAVEHKPYDVPVNPIHKAEGVTVYGVANPDNNTTSANTGVMVDGVTNGTGSWGTGWTDVVGSCEDTYMTFDLGTSQTVSSLKVYHRYDAQYTILGKYEIYVTDDAPVYDANNVRTLPTGLPAEPSQTGEVTEVTITGTTAMNELKLDNECTGRYVTLRVIDLFNKTYKDARAVHVVEMEIMVVEPGTLEDFVTITDGACPRFTTATDLTNAYAYGGNETYGFHRLTDNNGSTNGAAARGITDLYVTFDMGSAQNISELHALTNPYGLKRNIKDYEIFVSETRPVYNGRGELVDNKGTETTDDDEYKVGPAPTGIGTKAAEGTCDERTVHSWAEVIFETPVYGRYVTLHVKSIYDTTNLYFDVAEIFIYTANTATVPFDSLEIDYATGEVVMPESEGYTASIASSTDLGVVDLEGNVNVVTGGTSKVALKYVMDDGTIAYTTPFTVNVEARQIECSAMIGNKAYYKFADALEAVESGETIALYEDAETDLLVLDGIKIDLNGKSLTAGHVIAFKNSAVIDSEDNGKLVVAKDNVVLNADNDGFLPVYNADGYYTFTTVSLAGRTMWKEAEGQYIFAPKFEATANAALAAGADKSAVKVVLRLTWVEVDEVEGGYAATQDFVYDDVFVKKVIESYGYQAQKQEDGSYALAYTGIDDYGYCFDAKLTRTDVDATELAISAVLISDTGVEIASAATPFETVVEA